MCTVCLSPIEMQRKCLGAKGSSRAEFRSSVSSSTDSAVSSGSFVSSGSSIDVDLASPGGQPEFREIEQSELAQILRDELQTNHACSKKPGNLLILDCRNFADYNHSHIVRSINILYARMQRRRLLDNKLCCESLVNQHLKSLNPVIAPEFPSLEDCDVVLYAGDEKTAAFRSLKCQKFSLSCGSQKENVEESDDCSSSERCIRLFFDKLRNGSKLKCKRVMLLKGSFLDFRKQYPEFCESNEQSPIHNSSIETAPVNVGFPSLMNCQTGTQKTGSSNHRNNNNNPNISTGNNCSSNNNNNAMTLVLNATPPNRLSLPSSLSHPCLSTAPIFPNYDHDEEEKSTGPTQILDFMFLGSQDDAMDPEVLKRHGISKIINLSETCPRPDSVPESMNHFLRIPIKDSYSAKLLPHFDIAFDFLENAKKNNEKVLVHCLAGISRSATLAIAYVMRSKGIPSDEAYKFVKAKRPSISPNFNFMGQLLEYEKQLRERQLLLPAGRPHSYAASHCEEPSTSNSTLLSPTYNISKSTSSDFVLMAPKREALKNENGKRTSDAPLTFPERPRQLMKTGEQFFPMRPGSIPLTPSTAPLKGELPSPSTEFEKLGISNFSNPTFTELPDLSDANVGMTDSAPATLCIENPLFNAVEKSKSLPATKKASSNKFFQHHRFVKYLRNKKVKNPEPVSAASVVPCSSRCVLTNENRSGKIPAILGRRPFCRTLGKCGSGLQTVPDLPDDELLASAPSNSSVKSAKTGSMSAPPRSSISPIVRQRRSATVPTAIDVDGESPQDPYRDPERESIGSAEIAVN